MRGSKLSREEEWGTRMGPAARKRDPDYALGTMGRMMVDGVSLEL
jgi:hypothetical protein